MRAARDEEFRRYVVDQRASLLRTATLLTAGDAHLAEDLVQTTLTRLYMKWPVFQAADKPAAYARRALVNTLIDEQRRPWRRHEHVRAELPDLAYRALPEFPHAEQVQRALKQLGPRMRAAVVFRYFHDLSVAETADLLGCTQGTVKSQTARGLTKLRKHLGVTLDVPDDDPSPPALTLRSDLETSTRSGSHP